MKYDPELRDLVNTFAIACMTKEQYRGWCAHVKRAHVKYLELAGPEAAARYAAKHEQELLDAEKFATG